MGISVLFHYLDECICQNGFSNNPASETLFSRFLIGLLFLLPFVIKDRDFKVDTRQWKFLILRNAAGVSNMLINFLCREVLTAFHRCLIDEYLCPIYPDFVAFPSKTPLKCAFM